jgi:hypothetical protein
MAGRPAGLSDDDTDSEDEFFRGDFQMPISKLSNNNNTIRSRQNLTGPSVVKKEVYHCSLIVRYFYFSFMFFVDSHPIGRRLIWMTSGWRQLKGISTN